MGGVESAVARQRSLQTRRRRGPPDVRLARWASAASSAPCAVARALNSEAPRVVRWSSRTSRPRRHASNTPRAEPAACARSACAAQPVIRASGGPPRLLRAATAKCRSASAVQPNASAMRPANSEASGADGEPKAASLSATAAASATRRPDARPAANRASIRTSWACVSHQVRRCAANSRTATAARAIAVCGSSASRAARAATSSNSALRVDCPPMPSSSPTAVSAYASASPARPALISTSQRRTVSMKLGVASLAYISSASSRSWSATGMSPDRNAASPRLSTTSALSCSWPVVSHSRSAAVKSASARSTAPSARCTVARSVIARAIQITSSACRSTAIARRTSSSASPCRPSTHQTYARRYSTRARVCPVPRAMPRSKASRPCRVRPACTNATPSVPSTSASRSAESARAARSRARRRWCRASRRSPKSRCHMPIAWCATEARNGVGSPSRTSRAPASASFGAANTIGSSSRTESLPAVTSPMLVVPGADHTGLLLYQVAAWRL